MKIAKIDRSKYHTNWNVQNPSKRKKAAPYTKNYNIEDILIDWLMSTLATISVKAVPKKNAENIGVPDELYYKDISLSTHFSIYRIIKESMTEAWNKKGIVSTP